MNFSITLSLPSTHYMAEQRTDRFPGILMNSYLTGNAAIEGHHTVDLTETHPPPSPAQPERKVVDISALLHPDCMGIMRNHFGDRRLHEWIILPSLVEWDGKYLHEVRPFIEDIIKAGKHKYAKNYQEAIEYLRREIRDGRRIQRIRLKSVSGYVDE